MQEFSVAHGFRNIPDFIHGDDRSNLAEVDYYASLGYSLLERLFSDSSRHKIEVYESAIDAVYGYIVVVRTPSRAEPVACRSFFDFLELMRMYLPVVEKLNTVAATAVGWQRQPTAAMAERRASH